MRVTIHDTKGGHEVHAASCNAEVLSQYPLTVEVADRTAAVHEVWGEEIREDGDFRSRRADFRFHSCLEQLPEGRARSLTSSRRRREQAVERAKAAALAAVRQ